MKNRYLITGASSGIGYEVTKLLLEAGHSVVAIDKNPVSLPVEQTILIDLTDENSASQIVEQLNGTFDGLCNNAGIPPIEGLDWQILAINYRSPISLVEALVPFLNQGASIVNLASRAGQAWLNQIDQIKALHKQKSNSDLERWTKEENINATAAYNLSKAALICWTQANSERLTNMGFRINSVSPSAVATGIFDDFVRAFGEKMAANLKRTGRAGNPLEIAECVQFLLSNKSSWIRGLDLFVDGGINAFQTSDRLALKELEGA